MELLLDRIADQFVNDAEQRGLEPGRDDAPDRDPSLASSSPAGSASRPRPTRKAARLPRRSRINLGLYLFHENEPEAGEA